MMMLTARKGKKWESSVPRRETIERPLSDSEDEGPLVAPRNKTSGDGRAHTPQKN